MVRTLAFAALLVAGTPAAAQDLPPEDAAPEEAGPTGAPGGFEIGGEVTLMSDYRFRGVSRSDEDPAVQAGLTVRHETGLYAGARGTTLRGLDSFRRRDPGFRDLGDVQVDLYAGYGADLGDGFELDAGLIYSIFAGGEGGTDYAEPYASLSYLIGPVYATAGAKYAPAQDAIGGEDMVYVFGQVDVTIPFRPWSFSLQAGHQDWGRFGGYWSWSLGAEYHLRVAGIPNAEIGLKYVDTGLPAVAGQDAGVVLTARIGF